MQLCFPVLETKDLESEVYGHFGSAPVFLLVDSDTESVTVLRNADRHHAHGMCNPTAALEGRRVDAVIVGGIGAGALMKLNGSGIRVYRAAGRTIRENIDLFKGNGLQEFQPGHGCAGHGRGCSH